MNIGLILLAAGGSTRMGSPKQLLLHNGKTFLRNAADAAIASGCSPIVVVLGHDAQNMQTQLQTLPTLITINPHWKTGMGSSIRVGIEHLENISTVDAAMITLCDQPRVDSIALCKLLEAYDKNKTKIIAAAYNQTLGVPALFPRQFFPALRQLSDSTGAKQMMMNHPDDLISTPLPEAALDIDTPEDFQKLSQNKLRRQDAKKNNRFPTEMRRRKATNDTNEHE